jgi:hypothetical protein
VDAKAGVARRPHDQGPWGIVPRPEGLAGGSQAPGIQGRGPRTRRRGLRAGLVLGAVLMPRGASPGMKTAALEAMFRTAKGAGSRELGPRTQACPERSEGGRGPGVRGQACPERSEGNQEPGARSSSRRARRPCHPERSEGSLQGAQAPRSAPRDPTGRRRTKPASMRHRCLVTAGTARSLQRSLAPLRMTGEAERAPDTPDTLLAPGPRRLAPALDALSPAPAFGCRRLFPLRSMLPLRCCGMRSTDRAGVGGSGLEAHRSSVVPLLQPGSI